MIFGSERMGINWERAIINIFLFSLSDSCCLPFLSKMLLWLLFPKNSGLGLVNLFIEIVIQKG